MDWYVWIFIIGSLVIVMGIGFVFKSFTMENFFGYSNLVLALLSITLEESHRSTVQVRLVLNCTIVDWVYMSNFA